MNYSGMSIRIQRLLKRAAALSGSGALAGMLLLSAPHADAQTLGEMNTVTSGMDTLNEGPVGPAPGAYIDPAQAAAGAAPGAMPEPLPGELPGTLPDLGGVAAQGGQAVQQQVQRVLPRVTVISGTRVFDAVTGVLLDDAREKQVTETERDEYFDDGSHGDVQAEDGKYTRVESRNDVLSQSNQRIKEQLTTALVNAEQLNPLQFYGFDVMSTERTESVSRNRAWKIVPDPKGGPGRVLAEVPIDEPLVMPKYRTWLNEKDTKVKDDWARRFLQEYRLNKESLTSEFYPLYIPLPPPMPTVAPPPADLFTPFADPGVEFQEDALGGMGGVGGAGGAYGGGAGRYGGAGRGGSAGGYPGGGGAGGVTGSPYGAASSRYF